MMDIHPGSSNPYFAKAKMHRPEMFFGRADLLRKVFESVFHRQCVSIVGPRGIGKTSFLWYARLPEAQKAFPFDLSHHLFVFLDLREYLRKSSADFFHQVSREMIREGKKRGLTLHSDGTGEDEFGSILDQIEDQGFFPVLLLDAFDKVTLNEQFDPAFFEFLRAFASSGQVSYVTASLAPLFEICHSGIAGSPFFNIFDTCHLEALSPQEACRLISEPASESGLPFSNSEIALILKWAGHHPFFLQRICYLFWEEKRNGGKIQVKQLRDRVYKELSPTFEEIWRSLSEDQQKLLQDEARLKEHQQRQFPELSESSIFRLFIRTLCRITFFDLTFDELEAALKHLDDLAALGETNLRLMKLVALRLKDQQNPTAAEKGMAIRSVLNEALQRLRGSGRQSDGADDWRYYNILHYSFFKKKTAITNEQLAARLGVGVRTYYRNRGEAIEKLRQELIEMEMEADRLDDEE